MNLLFEQNVKNDSFFRFPPQDLPEIDLQETLPEEHWRTTELGIPETSEIETARYFAELANGVGARFVSPLGDFAARAPGFANLHPAQPIETVQGALELIFELSAALAEITGTSAVSLAQSPDALGESTGFAAIRAYFQSRGEAARRRVVLVARSAREANATAARLAGFDVRTVEANGAGRVDLGDLNAKLGGVSGENPVAESIASTVCDVAAIVLATPNEFGVFETETLKIAAAARRVGALLYADGANLNAISGVVRVGDLGFDLVRFDLTKMFAAVCGAGSGASALGVKSFLEPFLPIPRVVKAIDGEYELDVDRPLSIGKTGAFLGNFGACVRAYAAILALGCDGVKRAGRLAVLNANYLRARLADEFAFPFAGICKSEFLCVPKNPSVRVAELARRLVERGFRVSAVAFPPTVDEALSVEPTELASKERLDDFIDAARFFSKK